MAPRLLFAALVALSAGCLPGLAATKARPVPAKPCPERPLSADYDPSDPASVRKNLRTAPRIVLALGRTRHEQLRTLLERGENPNVCVLGSSVLALSAASGDVEEVEILLDGGADPDRPKDSAGGTPLLLALNLGHFDVARLLIARGADVRAATSGKVTSLMELADALPPPALHAEQLELAETLVNRGVAIDERRAGPGTTALMMASIHGNKDLVQLLLRLGADARLEDNKGQTALTFARKKGRADVVELLLAASAAPASTLQAAACTASPAQPCPPEPRKSP
jgi:ankyrin repeat protein